jgi:hypothetical protein
MRTTFTLEELTAFRKLFDPMGEIDANGFDDFHSIFDGCEDSALLQLARAEINFLSKLAHNACIRRALVGVEIEDAKLDELAAGYDAHVAEKEHECNERLDAEEKERAEAYGGPSHEDDLIEGEWGQEI